MSGSVSDDYEDNFTSFTSCVPISESNDSNDGGLPLIFGINAGIGLFMFIVFCLMHVFTKDYAIAAIYGKEKPVQESSPETGDDAEVSKCGRRWNCCSVAGWNYCESFLKFVLMSEHDVRVRSGPDASLYLTMELYMLSILLVYTFFSIVIILPVNYLSGDLQTDLFFARTTIVNIRAESAALWSHVLFSVLYVIIAGLFMIHYSVRLGKLQHRESSHTVMIVGIPGYVHVEDLMQHFEEALPGKVVDIEFAYNIDQLHKKWKQLQKAKENLEIAEAYEDENNKPLIIHSTWNICSKNNLVEAKDYYSTKVDHLKVSVAMERNNALTEKLPIAFVTFAKKADANMYLESYKCCRHKPESSLTDSIESNSWDLNLAPNAQDIIWENLSTHRVFWWIRWFFINILLFLFVLFFTTPAVLLNVSSVEIEYLLRKEANLLNISIENITDFLIPGLQSYVSSFLLWFLAVTLQFCIIRIAFLEFHWSKSKREEAMLVKGFLFLTLQVLILPSLGLTSLNALAVLIVAGDETDIGSKLSCVFLPNNGAFFVSYLIISTFVSAPFELWRLAKFMEYVYRRVLARTKMERQKIIQKILRHDYLFSIHYALNLLIFTLATALSLTTPIIVPFGVLFFVVRYLVDKYNLLYGYKYIPTSHYPYLHNIAMKLVMVGAVHLQFVTLFYSVVREGKLRPRSIVMMVIVSITCFILFGLLVLGWFSNLQQKILSLLGKEYSIFDDRDVREVDPVEYIAPVLQETAGTDGGGNHLGRSSISQGYESFGRTFAGGQRKLNLTGQSVVLTKRPLLMPEHEEEEKEEETEDGVKHEESQT